MNKIRDKSNQFLKEKYGRSGENHPYFSTNFHYFFREPSVFFTEDLSPKYGRFYISILYWLVLTAYPSCINQPGIDNTTALI